MLWWGWIILGAFLFGSELLLIDAGFYLVIIGVAAILTGFLELVGLNLEPWLQWLVFAALGVLFMVFFRKQLYQKLHGGIGEDYQTGPAGDHMTLTETIPAKGTGRQVYRGSDWTVVNVSNEALEKGTHVQITSVDGLSLNIDRGKIE